MQTRCNVNAHLGMRCSGVNDSHAAVLQSGPSNVRHEVSWAARPYRHRSAPADLVVPVHYFQVSATLDQGVVLGDGKVFCVTMGSSSYNTKQFTYRGGSTIRSGNQQYNYGWVYNYSS